MTTTITVTVNVYDGCILLSTPDSEDTDLLIVDGRTLPAHIDLKPWGVDEEGMDRADAALRELDLARTSEWYGDGAGHWTASVAPVTPPAQQALDAIAARHYAPEALRERIAAAISNVLIASDLDLYAAGNAAIWLPTIEAAADAALAVMTTPGPHRRRSTVMTTTSDPVIRDEAWFARERSIARALLITAAMRGEALPYGELSRHAHLLWYGDQVLDPVSEGCAARAEPDLTGILVRQGDLPDDPRLAAAVFDYWTYPR